MVTPAQFQFTQSPSTLPRDMSKFDYKSEFLTLLMTQLKFQDPTAPFDSQQMVAQQAQFASLEQMQSLNQNLLTLLAMQNVSQATNMLGKTVSGISADGSNVSGTVVGIDFAEGVSTLTVDDGAGNYSRLPLPNVASISQ
jgi:flagellar basal-body rod modification protein FlgD